MAQAYGDGFARVYAKRWAGFSHQVAPHLLAYIEAQFPNPEQHSLLDLCCGAGFLARHFLQAGYCVMGIDLSPPMLKLAGENNQEYVESGQAAFRLADAANFSLETPVWIVVSTFDALNHLPSMATLESCFRSVAAALHPGGLFIFDLNTPEGIRRNWNGIAVEDSPELTIINRSVYDAEGGRAYTRISGYSRVVEGVYERFEETVYNTVFDLSQVEAALLASGFGSAACAAINDLSAPLANPQGENRVFFVARKQGKDE